MLTFSNQGELLKTGQTTIYGYIQLPPCQLSANNIKILSTIKTSCQRMFWAEKKSGATFITMMMVPYFGGDVGRGWST